MRIVATDDPPDLAQSIRSGHSEIGVTEQGPANVGLVEHAIADQELVAVCARTGDSDPGVLDLATLSGVPLVLAGAGIAFVPRAIAEVASSQGAIVRRTRPRRVALVHRTGTLSPAGAQFLVHAQAAPFTAES